ncbi:YidC/Oxa1 family membrane protein insertase [Aliiroseovarius halocynthiae]|uniref:Membrane protein insertase YidC n=1 Tax=Aliiroseovarius halocynthiae TaxID=985055 RepID=A0A545SXU9_9RHOB|nr:membrane protein insertase YidC [Aliiroseovarius halocynthiae]TQV69783.1 membrane protein insertase YidC [Aliiroseovarius halocynthiae]SMR81757.1 YidC/Oxa1 family membrane protein insertase [Aliiroseovarius halocynthiae]
MDDQNKNLILATVLSFIVITGWLIMFPPVEPPVPTDPATETSQSATTATPTASSAVTDAAPADIATQQAEAGRVDIDTSELSGSISLLGGRIDDLKLKQYRVELSEDSDIVTLLRPAGEQEAYYALYGWTPGGTTAVEDVPGPTTVWSLENGATLTPATPVTLRWDSPAGLIFRRTISVDEDFMFQIDQAIENTSAATQRMAPYGVIARHGEPQDQKGFFILHEGLIREIDGELEESDYSDIADLAYDEREASLADVQQVAENGWLGFTDHYWMTTLIPEPGQPFTSVVRYADKADIYQAQFRLRAQDVAPDATASATTYFFAGAKEWETIRAYEKDKGIDKFIDSIDWGWFFFLTKPIFAVLHWLNALIGNMGWAIIGLTLVIKAILFPLAYKSYVSMAKMKELQPEMEKIKERAGDDRQKVQQEMMELYKKEKVNPASGCLPILLQIPIFFSLYKVIFVTLELRHAPWIGWIQDLSAPDPSSILNLFGLLPYATPSPESFLAIISLGVLPILLGISMWLQQKLNPAPTDATQAMIFAWMPWVFMFMLGGFASGLVVYWIANNTITFIQQYTIMRSHGHKPDVLGNVLKSFKKRPKDAK